MSGEARSAGTINTANNNAVPMKREIGAVGMMEKVEGSLEGRSPTSDPEAADRFALQVLPANSRVPRGGEKIGRTGRGPSGAGGKTLIELQPEVVASIGKGDVF